LFDCSIEYQALTGGAAATRNMIVARTGPDKPGTDGQAGP
jgi:hypothetical protein